MVQAMKNQMARHDGKTLTNTRVGLRWEYKSGRMEADADLSQYGTEGWELVSVVPVLTDPGQVTAYFKRAA